MTNRNVVEKQTRRQAEAWSKWRKMFGPGSRQKHWWENRQMVHSTSDTGKIQIDLEEAPSPYLHYYCSEVWWWRKHSTMQRPVLRDIGDNGNMYYALLHLCCIYNIFTGGLCLCPVRQEGWYPACWLHQKLFRWRNLLVNKGYITSSWYFRNESCLPVALYVM